MAKYNAGNATLTAATPRQLVTPGDQSGRIRSFYDEFDVSIAGVALAASDTINFMQLPAGLRILECLVTSSGVGGSAAINLGWLASATALEVANATAFYSALVVGSTICTSIGATYASTSQPTARNHILLEAVQVQAVLTVTGSGATGKIQVEVMGTID